jgi:hypothetical protein
MNVTSMNVTLGTTRRLALVLAVFAAALLFAGCGGTQQDPVAQALVRSGDRADVAHAEADVDRAALDGGDLKARTLDLVHALRQARSDGVSDSWIDKQIDSTQEVVVDCDSCYSMLEDTR